MFEKALQELYADFWDESPNYYARKLISEEALVSEMSFAIIGPRRVGKSFYFYEIRDFLISRGAKKTDFAYVNFEDSRLIGFSHENFEEILQAYERLFPDEKPILLLDEIQVIDEWYRFVRRLIDRGYRVFITGSNSSILDKEITNKLGARIMPIIMYPLDFTMFIKCKGVEPTKINLVSKKNRIFSLFDEYLEYGGFPEITKLYGSMKTRRLSQYFNLLISDIVRREHLRGETELRLFSKKIRENAGNEFTVLSFEKIFNYMGYKTAPKQFYLFLDYLQDYFFLMQMRRHKKSLKHKTYSRKAYLIDNGFLSVLSISEDIGIKLENLVYLELIGNGMQPVYFKEKNECDFIIQQGGHILPIQVTKALGTHNFMREVEGIVEAAKYFGVEKGLILTYEQERQIIEENIRISVIPAWKWIIQNRISD